MTGAVEVLDESRGMTTYLIHEDGGWRVKQWRFFLLLDGTMEMGPYECASWTRAGEACWKRFHARCTFQSRERAIGAWAVHSACMALARQVAA